MEKYISNIRKKYLVVSPDREDMNRGYKTNEIVTVVNIFYHAIYKQNTCETLEHDGGIFEKDLLYIEDLTKIGLLLYGK